MGVGAKADGSVRQGLPDITSITVFLLVGDGGTVLLPLYSSVCSSSTVFSSVSASSFFSSSASSSITCSSCNESMNTVINRYWKLKYSNLSISHSNTVPQLELWRPHRSTASGWPRYARRTRPGPEEKSGYGNPRKINSQSIFKLSTVPGWRIRSGV